MSSTRVFRRPYATGSHMVSVQVSFRSARNARRFARALDKIKAQAALERLTFSGRLLVAVEREARHE